MVYWDWTSIFLSTNLIQIEIMADVNDFSKCIKKMNLVLNELVYWACLKNVRNLFLNFAFFENKTKRTTKTTRPDATTTTRWSSTSSASRSKSRTDPSNVQANFSQLHSPIIINKNLSRKFSLTLSSYLNNWWNAKRRCMRFFCWF